MRPVPATRSLLGLAAALCALLALLVRPPAAQAAGYTKITGSGSTWSSNAVEQWRRNIGANIGLTVNFNANGSSQGREQFKNGTVDFAVSEIPYGLKDGSATDVPPGRGYAYMPIVAGGTAFMYNLRIGGQAGHQPAPLRLRPGPHLHRAADHVERARDQGRQPRPHPPGPPHRARRALRRLGHHRPVHHLARQGARRRLGRLLAGARAARRPAA